MLRSAIERQLDQALNREQAEAVFTLPAIRRELDAEPEREHVFIVLGSPVTEVGRDHDYDWAIVEPSSMRSLIQLAGRLRRHRPDPWDKVNVLICERNLRSVEQPNQPAFRRPGFENEAFALDSHLLSELLGKTSTGIWTRGRASCSRSPCSRSGACRTWSMRGWRR